MPWTLVQHSAAAFRDDPRFKKGLEVVQVTDVATITRIRNNSGLLFGNRHEAAAFEVEECYPKGYKGLVPKAPGRFSYYRIDGQRVYVPHVPLKEGF